MSEDFKNLTDAQVAGEIDRLNAVLDRNQHNPAQLTKRVENIQGDCDANRLACTVTITDNLEAIAVALGAAGQVGVAKTSAIVADDFFKVNGTGDFTGNDLAAAKGSAPAAGDIFYCPTASTVKFIGQV